MLCRKIVAAGIPLWRVSVFVRTLHPHVMGRRFTWQPGFDVTTGEAPYEMLDADMFRLSPVVHVYNTGEDLAAAHSAIPTCRAISPWWTTLSPRRARPITSRPSALHQRRNPCRHLVDAGTRRGFDRRAYRRPRGSRARTGARGGNHGAAPHHAEPARHLCGRAYRRAHHEGPDPARRHRGDPRRDLAFRHAGVHGSLRPDSAPDLDPAAQCLFRRAGAGDRAPRRRGAEIHRRRAPGDFPGRCGRRRHIVPRGIGRRPRGTDRDRRSSTARTRSRVSIGCGSAWRSMSAK